jgi:hypothetical protein
VDGALDLVFHGRWQVVVRCYAGKPERRLRERGSGDCVLLVARVDRLASVGGGIIPLVGGRRVAWVVLMLFPWIRMIILSMEPGIHGYPTWRARVWRSDHAHGFHGVDIHLLLGWGRRFCSADIHIQWISN